MNKSLLLVLLLATSLSLAGEAPKGKRAKHAPEKKKEEAPVTTSAEPGAQEDPSAKGDAKDDPNLGMSILGNQETPKALVIVPWKRSEIGNSLGISTVLDDSRLPIDKEVFMRMLSYYDIRSESAHQVGAPAAGRDTAPAGKAAQPATAAHRRKS